LSGEGGDFSVDKENLPEGPIPCIKKKKKKKKKNLTNIATFSL